MLAKDQVVTQVGLVVLALARAGYALSYSSVEALAQELSAVGGRYRPDFVRTACVCAAETFIDARGNRDLAIRSSDEGGLERALVACLRELPSYE